MGNYSIGFSRSIVMGWGIGCFTNRFHYSGLSFYYNNDFNDILLYKIN
ncbi:hypothetical protein QE429_004182 [Bacillus sp. SORGH_AS 510]|nr:hypothetical protein [Bacillus sp. SORGH_AS_0510]